MRKTCFMQIVCTPEQLRVMLKTLRLYVAARENHWELLCEDLIREIEKPVMLPFERAQVLSDTIALMQKAGAIANRDGYIEDECCQDARRIIKVLASGQSTGDEHTQMEFKMSVEDILLLQKALEEYFRIRYHQYIDFSNDICRNGFRYDLSDSKNSENFRKYMARRDAFYDICVQAGRVADPWSTTKTVDCCIAEDIWAVIRHFLFQMEFPHGRNVYDVRAYTPILISGETYVGIKQIE